MPRFKNILLIDDNEITIELEKQLILNSGFAEKIIIKPSAVIALQYLRSYAEGDAVPEIIFLDIRMPVMDGFGFLSEYEKLPGFITGQAKIVMLSSSLDKKDREKAKANPYVIDFITKPLTNESLNNIQL